MTTSRFDTLAAEWYSKWEKESSKDPNSSAAEHAMSMYLHYSELASMERRTH